MTGLEPGDLDPDPFAQFERWFVHAREAGEAEPDAMSLATATSAGAVSSRMVLLRGFDRRGFVFYTNLASRKSRELRANPRAALAFRWPLVGRQFRVTGGAAPVDDDEADAYFATRPRPSQLGAWASPQSEVIADRSSLDDRIAALAREYDGRAVPRPPFWGGWRVVPDELECWQQGRDRLHDRFRYRRAAGGAGWVLERLAP